jgi:hypothetical protein
MPKASARHKLLRERVRVKRNASKKSKSRSKRRKKTPRRKTKIPAPIKKVRPVRRLSNVHTDVYSNVCTDVCTDVKTVGKPPPLELPPLDIGPTGTTPTPPTWHKHLPYRIPLDKDKCNHLINVIRTCPKIKPNYYGERSKHCAPHQRTLSAEIPTLHLRLGPPPLLEHINEPDRSLFPPKPSW